MEATVKTARVVPAALLSFLVPGAGVFYAGRPWLAVGVAVGIQLALLAGTFVVVASGLPAQAAMGVFAAEAGVLWIASIVLSVRVASEGRELASGYGAKTAGFVLAAWLVKAILVPAPFAESFAIAGQNMEPNLTVGDRILVDKRHPTSELRRGDVVAFVAPPKVGHSAGAVWIERVVALEGDTVAVEDGRILVNESDGEHGDCDPELASAASDGDSSARCHVEKREGGEPFSVFEGRLSLGRSEPLVVPPDHVYVVGDNRPRSRDSRSWGPLPRASIIGRSVGVYWSAP